MKQRVGQWFGRLKPLLGLALLAVVAKQVDWAEIRGLLREGDYTGLVLAALCFLAALGGLQYQRLHLLVAEYTGSWLNTLRVFLIGVFFNNLLPSNVGGDAVRLLYLRNLAGGEWARPLSMLMLHRLSGLGVMLGLYAVYMLLFGGRFLAALANVELGWSVPTWVLWAGLTGACVVAGGLTVLVTVTELGARLQQRMAKFVGTFKRALQSLSMGRRLALVLWTIGFHGCRVLAFHLALTYFGADVPMLDLIPVLTFVAVCALVPITVGGLGLMEGSVAVGLGLFGVSPSVAVAVALVQRLAMLLLALLGGLTYVLERGRQAVSDPA